MRLYNDLYLVSTFALISASVLAFAAPRSRWWRLGAVPLCVLTLGLALRFCARTYPGIFYPDSEFLNHLLNGSGLFTDLGYALVLALGLADATFVFLTLFQEPGLAPIAVRSLVAMRLVLLALILLILAYGGYYAVLLQWHWSM